MDAEEAHRERLVEIAAAAHQHAVALNYALALRSLHVFDGSIVKERAEAASADAAALAADKALSDWNSPEARLARGIDALP